MRVLALALALLAAALVPVQSAIAAAHPAMMQAMTQSIIVAMAGHHVEAPAAHHGRHAAATHAQDMPVDVEADHARRKAMETACKAHCAIAVILPAGPQTPAANVAAVPEAFPPIGLTGLAPAVTGPPPKV
jgi:hypothetical protein